jgi:hypothetical protein
MLINTIIDVFEESIKITAFVMVMMIVIDFINVKTKNNLSQVLINGGRWRQYITASVLAAFPGCFGAFAGVSLYIHGMISFGAITGLMFAASGDEMFVMLAMFPKTAIVMTAVLFVLGIVIGVLTDFFVNKYHISTCSNCHSNLYHTGREGYKHYFTEHIWGHIVKEHLLRILIWTFGALLVVETAMKFIDLKSITANYSFVLLVLSAFIGLIPESGPHLIFVMLFSKGLIPFSILFTSSVVQDGHGMLPMLAYSVKDSIRLKIINLVFGLIIGTLVYILGF